MKTILRISLLLDFYGPLLTRRQYDIMDLRYNGDYSLGEIAEQLDITRQGVYDNIKKSMVVLEKLEGKLGLLDKHVKVKKEFGDILEMFNGIVDGVDGSEIKNTLQKIRAQLDEMDRDL